MELEGRTVLITGGGTGIGRELALLLASKGARLVLTGRRPEPLAETAQLVEAAGAQVRIVAGDVCDADHRRAALDEAERAFGGLDVLVNNAGNVAAGRLDSISEAEVRAMIEVNLVAPILLTRAALPLLRASGDGLVVNVASGIALVAMPFYGIYAAAKGGLSQFGEALRRELSGEGVRVMTAYPAATETAMMASSKIGSEHGVVRESPQSVATAIIEGMETDALRVICGGEARMALIALNNTEPEKVDAVFTGKKAAIEAAVSAHRSL
jgi:short-subunit dehydrogenase